MTSSIVSLFGGASGDELYQSAGASQAAGSLAGFTAMALIRGAVATPAAPASFCGNSNNSNTGWSIGRIANAAVAAPQGLRAVIQAKLGFSNSGGGMASFPVFIPVSEFVGRHFLFAFTYTGAAVAVYLNGARLQTATTFSNTYVPGTSKLTYGGVVADGSAEDGIDGMLYSSAVWTDAQHAAAFDIVRNAGGAAMQTLSMLSPSEYAYDSFSLRKVFNSRPAPVLVNKGTVANANLTFPYAVGNKLKVAVDVNPAWLGGSLIAQP